MSTKKVKPASTPTAKTQAPAEVATTLTTGSSTKEEQQGKGKSKGKTKAMRADQDSFGLAEPEVATVHECVGAALLMLPANLRTILGDKDLRSNALELETKEILVIVREAGVVAYVHLPIIVKELEAPATALSDGVVLLDITGSPSHKGTVRRSKAPVNPAANVAAKAAKPQGPRRRSDAK